MFVIYISIDFAINNSWILNFTPSPEIIHPFSSDNGFVCVMVVSWYLLSPSSILLASCLLKGNKVPYQWSFCDHTTRGQCPKNLRYPCSMRSQPHEGLWPPLLKLKFGNGWLTSNCCGSSCKKFNSGFQFQFQFQFQGFQFPFHFQFHQFQFQFQFQFRNWNWNWAAIPIPELNWPQFCSRDTLVDIRLSFL